MDDLDTPAHDHEYEMLVPFTACKTQGGPFDDDAFAAGFQTGQIDQALTTARIIGTQVIRFPIVHTALLGQLELIGMSRGFPIIHANINQQWPQWCDMTFSTSEHALTPDDPA